MPQLVSQSNSKPLTQEIASTRDGRDITRAFLAGVMPPSDPILQKRMEGHELYDEVLRDDQVYACLQQRRSALLGQGWQVEAGGTDKLSQMAADHLRENLEAMDFNEVIDQMHYGLFFGYAVAEAMWAADGRGISLEALKVRRPRRFAFGAEGDLRLLTRDEPFEGEALPEKKFWLFTAPMDHGDAPDGVGLAYWCYWPVFFKRNGLKFWLIYLEKFGMPTAIGTYDMAAGEGEQVKLLEAVKAIQTDSGIIVPEGMGIELLEASRSGHGDYEALEQRMDRAITKVILSQTMTTEEGSSRAQAEVHERMLENLARQDGNRLSSSFNCGPARWLTDLNYPGAKRPRIVFKQLHR